MKTTHLLRRPLALLLPFFAAAILDASATEPTARPDPAAQTLNRQGSIPVRAAGPYVGPGTLRIQVSTKLGRPSAVLPDGTWLYHRRMVEESRAQGTLVVRFNDGRVSSLTLVTPSIATALLRDAQKSSASEFVATK
jgi:hypothetical protein